MRKTNETYFQEGLEVARREGYDPASAKIFAAGYVEGCTKGAERMAKRAAIYLAAEDVSVEMIAKVTGADASVVRQWIAEQSPAAS